MDKRFVILSNLLDRYKKFRPSHAFGHERVECRYIKFSIFVRQFCFLMASLAKAFYAALFSRLFSVSLSVHRYGIFFFANHS